MNDSWWEFVNESQLKQGDLLEECLFPIFKGGAPDNAALDEVLNRARLIVLTQSCELIKPSTKHVALCVVKSIPEYDQNGHPKWELVRKGHYARYHMLASPEFPSDNLKSLIVQFHRIISLPMEYLQNRAADIGDRPRLKSPYLEHFSQAFARFFMRVGLPSDIPRFE